METVIAILFILHYISDYFHAAIYFPQSLLQRKNRDSKGIREENKKFTCVKNSLAAFTVYIAMTIAAGAGHSLHGQSAKGENPSLYIEPRLHRGFILIHSRDIRAVEDSYPWGFETDIGWHNASQRIWESCHCSTRRGFSLGFWDFDNPSILGQGAVAQFFIEPEFGTHRTVSFSIRGGLGLSYQNKPHHPQDNPENLSYSTLLAIPLHVGAALRVKTGEHWQVHLSGRYNHISNGSIKQPNKGINWPTLAAGVSYTPNPQRTAERPKVPWRSLGDPVRQWSASLFGSYHKARDGAVLGIGGAEMKYSAQVARLSALSAGAEWMANGRYPHNSGEVERPEGLWMGGIALGHEFLLGRFIFSQHMGVYLLKPDNESSDVYQRYGLIYLIREGWGAGVNFKAHGHVADFIDLRVTRNF